MEKLRFLTSEIGRTIGDKTSQCHLALSEGLGLLGIGKPSRSFLTSIFEQPATLVMADISYWTTSDIRHTREALSGIHLGFSGWIPADDLRG